MDTLEAIRTRRSVRRYRAEAVPHDVVEQVLEAGRWAPSADNSQPWTFIVVTDEQTRKTLGRTVIYGRFLAEAPVAIAVVIDLRASSLAAIDGAAATQNMLLAAHALGLGACWMGSYGAPYEETVKEMLGIPREKKVLSLISLGYPAESPSSTRKDLSRMVCHEKYDTGH